MSHPTKIYADFHNLDDANRLRLTSRGTLDDLRRLGITLEKDLRLTFYTDDADDEEQILVGIADWTTLRHQSDCVEQHR